MTFDLFVLPFSFGLLFVLISIGKSWSGWIKGLSKDDRNRFYKGFRSPALFFALREVFFESLLHRKMFRKNALLGYMHMSLAFGWFMLIVIGNMESRIYSGLWINPPYYPIFLKFFIHDRHVLPFEIFTVPGFFRFLMDLLLLFVLSGVIMAMIKRSHSRWFGMKKTTRHPLADRIALFSLWIIFPSRLMAESFTAGAFGYGGGFFTQHFGNVLAFLWPLSDQFMAYLLWWTYSLVLGTFFIALPYSRYMHIPTEVLLILFRNFGIKASHQSPGFTQTEIFSCSRCGVCIDACQLSSSADIHTIQPVYFIQSVRNESVRQETANRCLVCGRCQDACPVGISTDFHRLEQRGNFLKNERSDHAYLPVVKPAQVKVIYFSGCMGHLTPSVIHSVKGIFSTAGVEYIHLDKDGSICCGRPMMLAGKEEQARAMIEANKQAIFSSGAGILVTSCPICLRVFREHYDLTIRVLHHSQYILELLKNGKIPVQTVFRKAVYHDPCDLGRGLGIYQEPRELVRKVADLLPVEHEDHDSLCCGGSLGIFNILPEERKKIISETVSVLEKPSPELIVTGCPLCKKTIASASTKEVKDIAELVFESIPPGKSLPLQKLN
ncbi:MAG: (Fe-S)-binding protein [Syntrophothermus sp.]